MVQLILHYIINYSGSICLLPQSSDILVTAREVK